MRVFTLNFIILLLPAFLFGQNNNLLIPSYPSYHAPIGKGEGYVITNTNDTLFGITEYWTGQKKVNLVNSKTNKEKNYRADKIKKFKVENLFYESLILNDAHYFFKKLIDGTVSLYDLYDIPKNQQLIYGTKKDYFLFRNDTLVQVPYMSFKRYIADYFKDFKELSEKIRNKELGYDSIKVIVVEYNKWCTSKKQP